MPVLATRVGGLQEVVENGVNGHVFDKDDATAFVEKIIELSASPRTLQQLSIGARETVKKYAYNEHINKLINLYDNRQD
jgi:glycosyltransferase involved in cell wall biosynthesis